MAIFYKGVGIGTHWHQDENNPLIKGFSPRSPGVTPTTDQLMFHIARSTVNSPFISLTRSYGVAWCYAMFGGDELPKTEPAYVYEIEIQKSLLSNLQLLNPVHKVSRTLPSPTNPGPPYQHDGLPDFLLGVVNPKNMRHFRAQYTMQPPSSHGAQRPANLTIQLETLVLALRDAEILAQGIIPADCVTNRVAVHWDPSLLK